MSNFEQHLVRELETVGVVAEDVARATGPIVAYLVPVLAPIVAPLEAALGVIASIQTTKLQGGMLKAKGGVTLTDEQLQAIVKAAVAQAMQDQISQ